jgi:DNA-binding response OmpR family regulator
VTHKLLLADDSVTIQRVVELTFSGADVHVVTVGDGEQAIARIPVELPDIVLADIGMPKRSGYDVAAFVKGRSDLSHIPVLLLAGAFEPVDEARAQQVHSDGVLVKPFEPQQVISRVRDLIERSRAAAPRAPLSAGLPVIEHHERGVETVAVAPPPAVAVAQPHAVPEARDRRVDLKLDDYFERLDAAFAQLGHETDPEPPAPPPDDDEPSVPTLDGLLGARSSSPVHDQTPAPPVPVELSTHEPMDEPGHATHPAAGLDSYPRDGRNLVADMFAALFAAEQGESVAPAVPAAPPPPQPAALTDSLVDEVTRRVVERLAPDAAHDLVAQIVSEVAERLVREEISRIKAAAATRL